MTRSVLRASSAWLVGGLLVVSACGEPERPRSPDAAAADEPGAAATAEPGPPPRGPGCIRGGTTREEVRAIMGEPDSVSFGAWLYGRSEIHFGYGVVVDFRNPDDNLVLC